jgi:hypothetical protein
MKDALASTDFVRSLFVAFAACCEKSFHQLHLEMMLQLLPSKIGKLQNTA